MGLLGTLLGALALGVISACIAFACDDLTEQEKERQAELRQEYYDYELRRREEAQETQRYLRQERQRERERYREKVRAYQEALLQRRKAENRRPYQKMGKLWELQYEEKKALLQQCGEIVERCARSMEAQQHSNARFRSMKTTLLSLQEAQYKLEAYLRYMEGYREKMTALYEGNGGLPEPFSMTLPAEWPYEGKVVWLDKKAFSGQLYRQEPLGPVWLDKTNSDLFDASSGKLPFMYYTSKKGRPYLSLSKGLLKSSVGGTVGLDMEVVQVRAKELRLRFAGDDYLRVRISRRDLKGQNRRTPIGSSLHVFVKDHDFALKETVTVSERAGDGMSIAQFERVVMVLDREEQRELHSFLEKNDLLDESAEWRIGPLLDEKQELTGLILQNGIQYALRTAFEEVEGGGLVLRYQGRLAAEEFLDFEDAFVSADVAVDCRSREALARDPAAYAEVYEECGRLRLYLTREFAVQRRLLARSPMSVYLDQWLEVTRRLMEHRVYGGHLRLKVDQWEPGRVRGGYTLLHVENEADFRRFAEREAKRRRERYFLELPGEDGGRHYCRVLSGGEDGLWLRAEGMIREEQLLEQNFTLDLYSVGSDYIERQQVNAFRMFREGQVASEEIKGAVLQTGSYCYTDSGHRVEALFNPRIQDNPAQTGAVRRAFAEKHFFLIQGPPGTGKTTVIKELILQQLNMDPQTKIIVVSQANVAVDNVLRGIVEMRGQEGRTVRCGNEERIADDIEPYSFERRFEDYRRRLRADTPEDEAVAALRRKWLEIMEDKGNADLVGSCLLGCYQIIGATCLGLENRHYGLSGLEFDLAVIDEAGKALAGELLIPIVRAKKVVIIGDHLQLPPVVDPELYRDGGVTYDDVVDQKQQTVFTSRSFFQRLYEDCPESSKCMLNIQFRMPPEIAELVSRFFYGGTLETGAGCLKKKPMFMDHHLVFLDMKDEPDYREKQDKRQDGRYSGPYNLKELEAAAAVVRRVRSCYGGRMVVITPYRKQKELLIQRLEREGLQEDVDVNTIDAFQGDEADLVLYCTTRARRTTDYFSDKARLNVAFSRARNTLIFLGSSRYLRMYPEGHILRDIADYLEQRAAVVPYARWETAELRYRPDFAGEPDGEERVCPQCGQSFFLSSGEARFFQERGLELPKRCGVCRRARQRERVNKTP